MMIHSIRMIYLFVSVPDPVPARPGLQDNKCAFYLNTTTKRLQVFRQPLQIEQQCFINSDKKEPCLVACICILIFFIKKKIMYY